MPNYQKMYTTLFNAATDAITTLQDAQIHPVREHRIANAKAVLILQQAQRDAEETYMSAEE